MAHYKAPDFFTKNVFNPLIMLLTKLGISIAGSSVLLVRGRKSGNVQEVPVNPLDFDGARYLVAPRGTTQWVRNIRAAGEAELRRGGKRTAIRAAEVADADKPPILRAYLKKWKWEVGQFFDGVGADSSEDDLQRIAPNHPIFKVTSD